jgi:DNA-binding beta-propeller fold protein YncE
MKKIQTIKMVFCCLTFILISVARGQVGPRATGVPAQSPAVVLQEISVDNPYDLKLGTDGTLFVLSRSTGILRQLNSSGTAIRTSLSLGTTPSGFDLGRSGEVYVALTGNNQVTKLLPTQKSFEIDPTFNWTGKLGKPNGTTGTGNGEFNAPFDVAVAPDASEIDVSDSNNHRIQRFSLDGKFLGSFGSLGTSFGTLNTPKGLSFTAAELLEVADSGNNRIVFAREGQFATTFGEKGAGNKQFQSPINLSGNLRALYVADTGNSRIQKLIWQVGESTSDDIASLAFSWQLGTRLSLNQPAAVAVSSDLVKEILYIADTGNNRVLKIELLLIAPTPVWADFKAKLLSGDIEGALNNVATDRIPKVRHDLLLLTAADIREMMTEASDLLPILIEETIAKYRFTRVYQGAEISFSVCFVKENGKWKIVSF